MARFKQLCYKCKKKYVLASGRDRFVVCYDCQKRELSKDIEDPAMKKLFDIPEEFYQENSFLRSIKINCIRYGKLTEKQIEAFKKTVEKMKEESKN